MDTLPIEPMKTPENQIGEALTANLPDELRMEEEDRALELEEELHRKLWDEFGNKR